MALCFCWALDNNFVATSARVAKVRISELLQRLKGRTAHILLNEFAHLRKAFWGRHLWARGYFCCSSGNITDQMVKAYIENQCADEDDDFKVEEGAQRGGTVSLHLQPALRGDS